MHRFRKKSDAKRALAVSDHEQNLEPLDVLPELPPTNDFRSSLILPDLSRRFSLLRSVGDPLLLDQLRSRLADQRARGAENQITEEEEDMFLETLERMRPKHTPSASHDSINEGEMGGRNSTRSSTTTTVPPSPSSRSTKRYSNNLFGSGRLRDYTYLKSVASSRGSTSSSTRTVSLTPTEASEKTLSFRPVTPEASSNPSSSVQSSPNEKGSSIRPAPLVPSVPYGEQQLQAITVAEYRLQKTLGSSVLKRASMALDEAIREIEDEVEDEILLPRSVSVPRGNLEQSTAEVRHSKASSASSIFEGGMAISIDQTIHDEFSDRRASPVPARTIPGYVPGMPRPMTPRDVEFDEQRSHSTTPRAQSPYVDPPPSSPTPTGNISTSTKLRRESISSTSKPSLFTPVPAAPLFLQRSTNGRYTPDDSHRSGDIVEFDSSFNATILGRRRPASPLSGQQSYQPMAVSPRPSSRPGTPSNVIWNPNKSNHSMHSRNNSWTADGVLNSSDVFGDSIQPSPRSLRSPPPDSRATEPSYGAPTGTNPQAYIPESDFGSPLVATIRSNTPTQTAQRSPISTSFPNFEMTSRSASRRSSKQNPPSSPFNISTFPSLGFSPRANSSRSSLDSAGSSFHSWDEGDKVFSLFSDPREKQPVAWHDFDTDKSSSVTGGASADDEGWDPEEIIKRYAGLGRADIAAIQEKLVTAAFVKIANTDPRDRAPSSLRRRRPSTSQSNYPRIASPPPQVQPPASPSPYPSEEQSSKASALLNSMVESIKGQNTTSFDTPPVIPTSDDKDISSNTRRNRDLAHVLFGDDEPKEEPSTTSEEPAQPRAEPEPAVIPNIIKSLPTATSSLPPLAGEPSTTTPLTSPSPYLSTRNHSIPKLLQPKEEVDLTREVQQKTDAAMVALKKDPSNVNLAETLKRAPSVRKRIDPSQISTPRLVSASTSVDTIPLRTPSISGNTTSGASKLGSRFKKLRGSLRAKNVTPSGDETVVQDSKSPSPSQTAYYDPAKMNVPGGPSISSATETGRFKVPIPSPPASAGPGLKGFMARFRNRQRMSEMPSERPIPRATSPLLPVTSLTPRQTDVPLQKSNASIISERSHNSVTPRLVGQARPMYSRFPPANPVSASTSPPAPTSSPPLQTPAETLNDSQSATALEQLYAAAINLGVDQDALNDLLARSGSTSSRNLLAMNHSIQATPKQPGSREISEHTVTAQQVSYVGSTGSDQTATPTSYAPESSDQRPNNHNIASDNKLVTPSEEPVARKSSIRKPDYLRRPKEGQTDTAANAVVRRTIIYPSDSGLSATEFAAMVQRKNSSRRRRISGNSISNRSVVDRVPTPPPPRSVGVKRFSADGMPPMPQLPTSLGQAERLLNANAPSTSAGGAIEKSNSTYDSLYEMYAGESRVPSMVPGDSNGPMDQQISKGEQGGTESGPALEVIQLANGETIWSIVNGLRDADDESVYTGRTSFASEYSTREPGNDSGSIFVKEHGRSGSVTGVPSFISKKKPQQGKLRPETKVFHSSSAQIGRLIESLSQGVDSGSFNFLPNVPSRGPGHSASSSLSTNDMNWTVEERLDRMLGAINNKSS